MPIMRALSMSIALLLWSGCSSLVKLDWSRQIGWIIPDSEMGGVLEFPDTVRRGVPTAGTVTTRGSSSCTRPAGAEVTGDGLEVIVTPYDQVAPPGTGCTRDIHPFPRPVELRFQVAGDAMIRVVGIATPGSSVTVEVIQRVVVIP